MFLQAYANHYSWWRKLSLLGINFSFLFIFKFIYTFTFIYFFFFASIAPPLMNMHDANCVKCNCTILIKQKSLNCDHCNKRVHLKCSGLNLKTYNEILQLEESYTCQICSKCAVCNRTVAKNHRAIECSLCNTWVHVKCQKFDDSEYVKYQTQDLCFFCIRCTDECFPFAKINDTQFKIGVTNGINYSELSENKMELSSYQQSMVDAIKKSINFYEEDDESDDPNNSNFLNINCDYYNIDEFRTKKLKNDEYFSILNLNIHSIELHIEEFRVVLDMLKFQFDIICITETKIVDGVSPSVNINITNYQPPVRMDTKASKGGVLIYVRDGINFSPRNDLSSQKRKRTRNLLC